MKNIILIKNKIVDSLIEILKTQLSKNNSWEEKDDLLNLQIYLSKKMEVEQLKTLQKFIQRIAHPLHNGIPLELLEKGD